VLPPSVARDRPRAFRVGQPTLKVPERLAGRRFAFWRRGKGPPLELPFRLAPGQTFLSPILAGSQRVDRIIVCTPWLTPGSNLAELLRSMVSAWLEPGDLIAISEKAVVVATGRAVPAEGVRPGRLARFVARNVRPTGNSRGLSIPEKVQLVIDMEGRSRVLLAVAAGAVARPIGLHGAFYLVAGYIARSMDGMRPPYHDVLLPPLSPGTARAVAEQLTTQLGHPVAIVDINDRGGSVRAVGSSVMSKRLLAAVLADNPMGQREQSTPILVVRRGVGSTNSHPG
jgi:F420-0:gamma-glutamyl ligase